jgi:hypothetical protein
MSKELPNPSKISLLLDVSYKEVNEVIYFVNYIVLDEGNPEINQGILRAKEIVDLAKPKSDGRKKIQKILKIIAGLIEDKKSLYIKKPSDFSDGFCFALFYQLNIASIESIVSVVGVTVMVITYLSTILM